MGWYNTISVAEIPFLCLHHYYLYLHSQLPSLVTSRYFFCYLLFPFSSLCNNLQGRCQHIKTGLFDYSFQPLLNLCTRDLFKMGPSRYNDSNLMPYEPIDLSLPTSNSAISSTDRSHSPALHSDNFSCEGIGATSDLDSIPLSSQFANMSINQARSVSPEFGSQGIPVRPQHHFLTSRHSYTLTRFPDEHERLDSRYVILSEDGDSFVRNRFTDEVSITSLNGSISVESTAFPGHSSRDFYLLAADATFGVGDWVDEKIDYPPYMNEEDLDSRIEQSKKQVEMEEVRDVSTAPIMASAVPPLPKEINFILNKPALDVESNKVNSKIPLNQPESGLDENISGSITDLNDDDSIISVGNYLLGLIDDSQRQKNVNPLHITSFNLSPARDAIIDRIIDEFWSIFNHESDVSTRACKGENSDSSSPQSTENSQGETVSQRTNRKHARTNDNNDGERNEENSRKRLQPFSKPEGQDAAQFACPYRKHDPQKYGTNRYSSCAISHWPTVARVK